MAKNKNIVASAKNSELNDGKTFGYIPPGVYKFEKRSLEKDSKYERDSMSMMLFGPMDFYWDIVKDELASDEIVDLPSASYSRAVNELNSFLSADTRQSYDMLGYLYKRSWLFYGIPGTGKSILVKKFAGEIAKRGGIVFTNLSGVISGSFNNFLHPSNHENTIAIIVEEFEGIEDNPTTLTALDGGTQRNNMIFLCTTNHIEKIPPRLLRPGRIHSKIEVGPLEYEGRLHYVKTKVENDSTAIQIAKNSDGLVIDELKELIQQVLLLKRDAVEVTAELLAFRAKSIENYYDPEKDAEIQKTLVYNKNLGKDY